VVLVVRRLALSIPLLFIVSALVFLLMNLAPGDVTQTLLGLRTLGQTTPEQYKRLQHDLGLDQPLYTQYWHWLSNAFHGDLGSSLVTKQSVTAAITQRFPITLSLMGGALLIAVVFGVLLGVISAVRGGALGRVVDVVAMVGWVVPVYWIAAELVV